MNKINNIRVGATINSSLKFQLKSLYMINEELNQLNKNIKSNNKINIKKIKK